MSRLPMNEKTFLQFYIDTALGYSKPLQTRMCQYMESKKIITFAQQPSLQDPPNVKYFPSKKDTARIISSVGQEKENAKVFEYWEFTKLYKYSVPLFYEGNIEESLKSHSNIIEFTEDNFEIEDYSIGTSLQDTQINMMRYGDNFLIKFVLQKNYTQPNETVAVDYRYPIVVFFDTENNIMEIRYDAVRHMLFSEPYYGKQISDVIDWVIDTLHLKLFRCETSSLKENVQASETGEVKISKQMMQLSSGGAAELTASEDQNYILPFIGEIRELIDENASLFDSAAEVKELLIKYLDDKEATAEYPYIYVTWLSPVASQNYVVKFTFDYFNRAHTVLQHLTGNCKDLRMERMNNVIQYLCKNSSFVRGEEISH